MHVVQLGPFPPPNGGVQTNLKAIHDLLQDSGHRSSVIAITRSSQTDRVPNTFKPRSALDLIKLLFTLEFDVVHLHVGGNLNIRLIALMLICGVLPGRKSVLTMHSGGYASGNVNSANRSSVRGLAFRGFDFVIGVNEEMLRMFRRFGVPEQKMKLVLPFVLKTPSPRVEIPGDLQRFAESHFPLLVTIGLLEKEYGIPLQIDVIQNVLERFPKAGLIIAGSGSLDEELRRQIQSKKYSDNLFLSGDLDHEITLRIIEQASLMLRPTDFDGDAVSIREALFLRTPVIATDNCMRPDGVHLIPMPATKESLTRRILEVLEGNTQEIPVEGKDGWQNIKTVLEIYQDLLQVRNAKQAKKAQRS